ncbi:hypothetical protein P5V15_009557 [Pogonomyrmex californicus]
MQPCFAFCRIIAIFPYKINNLTFEASKLHYIVSTIIICIFSIYELLLLYHIYIAGKTDFMHLPATLQEICFNIFGYFIIIVTYILNDPRIRLLQNIWKISSRLPPESYRKLSKFIHAKDIIGFIYLIGLMCMVSIFWFNEYFWLQVYINLVIFQMDMLYINCVCILKACFKEICNNLIYMQELMAYDQPNVSRLVYHKQKNQFLIMKLNALKRQHLTISKTLQMLNTIFSLQLFATMIMTFSFLTINLYYYIMRFMFSTFINTKILFHMVVSLCILYIIIKVILMIWVCETGKAQALQISTFVHDVFNNVTDEEIKNELQLFSLQILHCNNTFSAKCFTINAKLLAEIIGNITTYIVIIFQFMSIWISCQAKMAMNNTARE